MNSAVPLVTPSPLLAEHHSESILFQIMERQFAQDCTPLHVKRSAVICNQGSMLSCLYMIKQGEILLTRLSPDGREVLLSILGSGEFFGESSLLSGATVTFSASATRRSDLLQLPESKFKRLLEHPKACHFLLETISRRCNDAWSQMEALSCTHVRDKIRSVLVWLSERIGVKTHEGVRIDLNQAQLARMIGCARETLSREVSELRRSRVIDVRQSNGRKSLFVVNPEGLC